MPKPQEAAAADPRNAHAFWKRGLTIFSGILDVSLDCAVRHSFVEKTADDLTQSWRKQLRPLFVGTPGAKRAQTSLGKGTSLGQ